MKAIEAFYLSRLARCRGKEPPPDAPGDFPTPQSTAAVDEHVEAMVWPEVLRCIEAWANAGYYSREYEVDMYHHQLSTDPLVLAFPHASYFERVAYAVSHTARTHGYNTHVYHKGVGYCCGYAVRIDWHQLDGR